jgi:hypothetical protein
MRRRSFGHGNSSKNWKTKNDPQSNQCKFGEVRFGRHGLFFLDQVCQGNCASERGSTKRNEIRIKTEDCNFAYRQSQTKNQNTNKADEHSLGFFIHCRPFCVSSHCIEESVGWLKTQEMISPYYC